MANVLYGLAKEAFLSTGIDWSADDLRVILVDTANYTLAESTDQFLNIITDNAGAEISRTVASMTNATVTLGVADADDIQFASVTGATAEAVVIYKQVTDDTDSPLIAYIDTATGLPVTPDGNNINVTWDSGVDKIFAL